MLAALPDPQSAHSVGWLLLTIAAVAAVVGGLAFTANQLLAIREKVAAKKQRQPVTIDGQPLEVREFPALITKPEFLEHTRRTDERLTAATAARKEIHARIDNHAQRLSALETASRHTEAALASIDQKLTTILQRLPR